MDGRPEVRESILRTRDSRSLEGKRICVVGGGLGGLCAAFEAMMLGASVTLFEARCNRGGGRVRTYKTFGGGTWVEAGPEFIGEQHLEWRHYADYFGLRLIHAEDYFGPFSPVIHLKGGGRFSEDRAERLTDDMSLAVPLLNKYAEKINADQPWLSPEADRLDDATVYDLLVDAADIELGSGTLLDAWVTQIEANQGAAPRDISLLGYAAQIKAHGVETFWKETEAFRCEGGVEQLATKFQEVLGESVRLGSVVSQVVHGKHSVTVHLKSGESHEFDYVIVAVPAMVLRKITFEPALSENFYMNFGRNTKFFVPLERDFPTVWGLNPLAIMHNGKGRLQLIWESTAGQETGIKVVCGFSGGDDARYLSNIDPAAARIDFCLRELNELMPGIREAMVGDAHFKNWVTSEYTGGGYSCPAPGDVTTKWKAIDAGCGRLHFAGEAYSWRYWGFMNGALESGVRAVERIVAMA